MAQMLFYSGVLKQDDKKFLINPFEKLVGETVLMEKEDYVRLTAEAYDYLVNALDLQHREPVCKVYISSDFDTSNLVDITDLQAIEEDEETPEAKLDLYKEKVFRMMNELISNQLMISNFELFHFFKLNHFLAAKGYFITDENREEKYLEVINEGDGETLRVLSEYLDSLDEFNAIDEVYEKYKVAKDKVKAALTEREVEDAYYELSAKLF